MANVKYRREERQFFFGGDGKLVVLTKQVNQKYAPVWSSRLMNVSARYIEEAVKCFNGWVSSIQRQTRRGRGLEGVKLDFVSPDDLESSTVVCFSVEQPSMWGSKTVLEIEVPVVDSGARQMSFDELQQSEAKQVESEVMGLIGSPKPSDVSTWEDDGGRPAASDSSRPSMSDKTASEVPALEGARSETSEAPKFKVVRGAGGRFQKVPVSDV